MASYMTSLLEIWFGDTFKLVCFIKDKSLIFDDKAVAIKNDLA